MTKERKTPNLVTYTTAVQLRIKQVILRDILAEVPRADTFRTLKKIIEAFGQRIPDSDLRQRFETALAKGAVELYTKTLAEATAIAATVGVSFAVFAGLVTGKTRRAGAFPTQPVSATEDGGDHLTEYVYEDRIGVPDIRKKVKEEIVALIRRLSREDLKAMDGASLRNLAEMHVRHEYQQKSIEQMRQSGVRLVWASTHVDCSPRCFPFQGRLYSLDGSYGTTATGIAFEPLENATEIPYTTHEGRTYMNGLLGFNCRHRLIPYKDEQEPPKGFSLEETRRQYALDLRQRAMEREIRRTKEEAHLYRGVDNSEASRLFEQARNMVARYRKFCTRNDRVAMIYRTQVTTEEQQYDRRE